MSSRSAPRPKEASCFDPPLWFLHAFAALHRPTTAWESFMTSLRFHSEHKTARLGAVFDRTLPGQVLFAHAAGHALSCKRALATANLVQQIVDLSSADLAAKGRTARARGHAGSPQLAAECQGSWAVVLRRVAAHRRPHARIRCAR